MIFELIEIVGLVVWRQLGAVPAHHWAREIVDGHDRDQRARGDIAVDSTIGEDGAGERE